MGTMSWTRDEAIAALRQWFDVHSTRPLRSDLDLNRGLPHSQACRRLFGSVREAFDMAELPPNPKRPPKVKLPRRARPRKAVADPVPRLTNEDTYHEGEPPT